jgi:hypothetical protein
MISALNNSSSKLAHFLLSPRDFWYFPASVRLCVYVPQKVQWVTFAQGQQYEKDINFTITEKSDVKWTVRGNGRVAIFGRFLPTFLDETDNEKVRTVAD